MDKAKTRASLEAQIRAIEAGSSYKGITAEEYFSSCNTCQDQLSSCDEVLTPESGEEELFKKIVRLIKVRERATEELRTRFLKDGYDESAIESALQRALNCNLLNDERFAEILIRSRLSAGKGEAGIRRELASLKIEIPTWIEEEYFNNNELKDEFTRAIELLIRKPPRSKNLRDGAYRKLIQKGYSPNVASEAAREWFSRIQKDSSL